MKKTKIITVLTLLMIAGIGSTILLCNNKKKYI